MEIHANVVHLKVIRIPIIPQLRKAAVKSFDAWKKKKIKRRAKAQKDFSRTSCGSGRRSFVSCPPGGRPAKYRASEEALAE